MRLLLIRPKIGFGLGGAESHAAVVATKLVERGFQVGIVAHTFSFPLEVLSKLSLYRVKWHGFGSVPKHLIFIQQAKKIIDQSPSHKVISFFRYPYPTDLFILCDPLIAFSYQQKENFLKNLSLRYRLLLHLEKKALREAKRVISLFSLGRGLLKEFYPKFYEKCVVCHRGVNLQRFNPTLKEAKAKLRSEYGFSEEDFVLLFVGYDARRKGLDLLLRVMAELPEKVKLLVVGVKGQSGLRVVYLGKVSAVEKFYALADLFVLPTRYDPGALATLEALASGTPVVTTRYDGTCEFVKEGQNGFVVERNPLALKEAILKAYTQKFDPKLIHQMVSHLTWDAYVDCLISQLEDL